jgi:hypothetical protein
MDSLQPKAKRDKNKADENWVVSVINSMVIDIISDLLVIRESSSINRTESDDKINREN